MAGLTIDDLRGGLNLTDTPVSLAPNQVVRATNIDWTYSKVGQKRAGTVAQNMSGSTLSGDISFLYQFVPASGESFSELWAGDSNRVFNRQSSLYVWGAITTEDACISAAAMAKTDGQGLHNKLFLGYQSAIDRLHVWDSRYNTVRRVGLAPPVLAPVVTNTAGVGTFAGVRYYRVRYASYIGAARILLSEPSPSVTFTPSGTNTGATVTIPVSVSDASTTHWIVEASVDGANFYELATTVVATTTLNDTTVYADGYTAGALSADIGDYTVPISAPFVAADEDRLVIGGSYEQPALSSRISWTPVFGDTTGVGNDERVPLDTDNYLDLDWGSGGALTALTNPMSGYLYAFKSSRIYKLARTGQRTRAYASVTLSETVGALRNSVVQGVDETGHTCLYFLDPQTGPARLGQLGLQTCGSDIQALWRAIETSSVLGAVVCHAVYYPGRKQVWWWVKASTSTSGATLIILNTRFMTSQPDGTARGGLALYTGAPILALCSTVGRPQASTSHSTVPLIGYAAGAISQCDTGTSDDGTVYLAQLLTKPFSLSALALVGVMTAELMAAASAGVSIHVQVLADYGLNVKDTTVDLSPVAAETRIIRHIDDLQLSEMSVFQILLGDTDTSAGTWELDSLTLKPTVEGSY